MQPVTGPFRSAAMALLLVVGMSAVAASGASGSHAGADAAASSQQATTGPDVAGVAWSHELTLDGDPVAMDLGGDIHGGYVLSSDGHFVLHGTVTSDLASTAEDEDEGSRGVLVAIDPDDGSLAWDAPAVDVDPSCSPVATSDGRILATLQSASPSNTDGREDLVAIDGVTGSLTGDAYESDGSGGVGEPESRACVDRLVLSDDESTVFVHEGPHVRAVDLTASPWAQAWVHEVDGARKDQLTLSSDGERLYHLVRVDDQWRARAIDASDGSLVDEVALPGNPQPQQGLVALEDGVLVTVRDCNADGDNCLVRVDDDGVELTVGMTTLLRPDGTEASLDTGPVAVTSVARLDATRVVVTGEDEVWAFDHTTGEFVWRTPAQGEQRMGVVTDPDGNSYFPYAGGLLRSAADDGRDRWQIPDCHLGVDADRLGPIADDGTLLVVDEQSNPRRLVLTGVRAAAGLPKGDCPEREERVSGINRVETSVKVSESSFPQPDSADTVVIATGTNYPDALAGGPLARRLDAPLLLTDPTALSPATAAEIQRLGAVHAILLGGPGALSGQVESDVRGLGLTTERIAGRDRFETAGLIADRVPSTTVYVTEGANADPNRGWPDAVAVSGLASFELRPIILVTRTTFPTASRDAMTRLGVTDAVVVGGEVAVSAETAAEIADPDGDGTPEVRVTRVAGASRYDTSVALATRSVAAGASTFDLWFATGLSFPDALAAGPAVARSGGVLLLVHGRDPNGGPEVYEWLEDLDEDDTLRAWLVGGTSAVTDEVADRLVAAARIG